MENNHLLPITKNEITLIYGEPATGKTTLAIQSAIDVLKQGKKVVFIDTEHGFSLERFKQISNNDVSLLDNLLILQAGNFYLQRKYINKLPELARTNKFGLIIIDTIGNHYRRFYSKNKTISVILMKNQLKTIKSVNKQGLPILITNQIYQDFNGEIQPVGKFLFNDSADTVLHLKKDPRRCSFNKPKGKEIPFTIKEEGIIQEESQITS